MLTKFSILLCLVCAIVLVGCAKSEPTSETPKTTPAATTPASTAPVASAGEKIGVPECDEYLTNYDACVTGKVPEVARAQYKSAIEQTRASWKKLAENPQTKASLAAACKQSAEQARTAMKSFNCTF
jgi:hypothetical protein